MPGYLGAVAVAPVTTILELPEPSVNMLGTVMAPGIAANFPEFKLEDILTSDGLEAFQQFLDV